MLKRTRFAPGMNEILGNKGARQKFLTRGFSYKPRDRRLIALGERVAKTKHMSFSAYIVALIEADVREAEERGGVIVPFAVLKRRK